MNTPNTLTFPEIIEALLENENPRSTHEQVQLMFKTIGAIKQLNLEGKSAYSIEEVGQILQFCMGVKSLADDNCSLESPGKFKEQEDFLPLMAQLTQTDSEKILQTMAYQGVSLEMAISDSWQQNVLSKVKRLVQQNQLQRVAAKIRGKVLLMEQNGEINGAKLLRQLYSELHQDLTHSRGKL